MPDWIADPHEFVSMVDNGAGPATLISTGVDGNSDNRVDFLIENGDDPPTGGNITITVSDSHGSFFMSNTLLGSSPLTVDYDTWVNQGISWVPTQNVVIVGPVTFSFTNDQGKADPPDVIMTGVVRPSIGKAWAMVQGKSATMSFSCSAPRMELI